MQQVLQRFSQAILLLKPPSLEHYLITSSALDTAAISSLGDVVTVPCQPRSLNELLALAQFISRTLGEASVSQPGTLAQGSCDIVCGYPMPDVKHCTISAKMHRQTPRGCVTHFVVREGEYGRQVCSGQQFFKIKTNKNEEAAATEEN